jgi:hypothetical protein
MALSKIFTTRYYTQNAAFFFLIFYFFFGIVPGGQLLSYHYTLIKAIVSNTQFLLLVSGIWLLYNLKCMAYIEKTLAAKESTFLYGTLGILEGSRKWRTLFQLHFSIYAPVFVYSCITFIAACNLHFFISAVIILLFNILMTVLPLFSYDYKIKHPGLTTFFAKWQEWLNRKFRKPLWMFYIYELLNGNIKALAITKLIGAAILLITCSLMGTEYDTRYLLVGLLINLLAHSVLVFNHRLFDDLYLSLIPHLPIPLWKRYLQTGATYLLLLSPEILLLFLKAGPKDLPLFIITGVSMLMLLRSLLYFPTLDQDKYFRWVSLTIVGVLFLSLAHLYWYAVVLLQLMAFGIFYYRYYRYEAPLQEVQ